MGEQYTENAGEQAILEKIKTNSVNVLSQFYGEIYFPTYSNGLKDIGKYLDRKWSEDNATGLQSLVWRSQWETTHDSCVKDKLIQYNLEDCSVLRTVVETISKISSNSLNHTEVVSVDDIHNESTYKFGPSQYLFQELEFVNKCAYFDYQREKICNYSGTQIIDITCNFLIILTVNPKVPLTVSPRQFKIFAQLPKLSSWKV